MICPQCQHDGLLSIVRITSTREPKKGDRDFQEKDHFFDEYGNEHAHNPNVVVTEYRCSNGHEFGERSSWECFCGYRACAQELYEIIRVSATQAREPVAPGERRAPARSTVITAEQRQAINERRGKR